MSTRMELEPPRFEDGKPLLIAGLRERVQTVTAIPVLWQRLMAYKISDQVGRAAYGLCFNSRGGGDSFDYPAGVEVSGLSSIPADLSHVSIPRQKYAVFAHREHVSTLQNTCAAIEKWLPQSGHKYADAVANTPDFFERYGEDFDPQTGMGGIEVWI